MKLMEKVGVYQKLLFSLNKGVVLAANLRSANRRSEADEVDAKNQDLAEKIGRLRQSIVKEWSGKADALIDEIGTFNDRLQTQIREIERGTSNAEKVINALGHLDDLIKLVSKIL